MQTKTSSMNAEAPAKECPLPEALSTRVKPSAELCKADAYWKRTHVHAAACNPHDHEGPGRITIHIHVDAECCSTIVYWPTMYANYCISKVREPVQKGFSLLSGASIISRAQSKVDGINDICHIWSPSAY